MKETEIHIVTEVIDGEPTVVGAFRSEKAADAHRDNIIREYAQEAIDCGTAPAGMKITDDVGELAEAFDAEVFVHVTWLRE